MLSLLPSSPEALWGVRICAISEECSSYLLPGSDYSSSKSFPGLQHRGRRREPETKIKPPAFHGPHVVKLCHRLKPTKWPFGDNYMDSVRLFGYLGGQSIPQNRSWASRDQRV